MLRLGCGADVRIGASDFLRTLDLGTVSLLVNLVNLVNLVDLAALVDRATSARASELA
jgi:hypothetical protein